MSSVSRPNNQPPNINLLCILCHTRPRTSAQITATRSATPRGIGTAFPAASRCKSRRASTAGRAGAISAFIRSEADQCI